MSIVAFIQARTNNSRLPGKDVMEIQGKKVIEHVVNRLRYSKLIDKIYILTTINEADYIYDEIFKNTDIMVFHGSENNVMERFIQFAERICNANDHILRITSDSPLICYEIINDLISKHIQEDNCLTCTDMIGNGTYPDGMTAEIIKIKILRSLDFFSDLKDSDKEHVSSYIKKNLDKFQVGVLKSEINYNHIRLCIDYKEDFELVKKIYDCFSEYDYFGFDSIMNFLKENPELLEVNKNIKRDESYFKDLEKDKHQ